MILKVPDLCPDVKGPNQAVPLAQYTENNPKLGSLNGMKGPQNADLVSGGN